MKRWSALLAAAALLGGCATDGSAPVARPATRTYSEATQFLGADGRVITVESSRAKARAAEAAAYWRGDGVTGAPSIVVNLTQQKAYFYKGGQLVGETPISSGNATNPTPTGRFRVIQKSKNHRSNLYGAYVDDGGAVVVDNIDVHVDRRPAGTTFLGASMPYFLRIHGGVGLHAGYLPGFPDSHGCIRLPDHMAEVFYAHANHGTPVAVVR